MEALPAIVELSKGQGFPVVLLMVAIWWMQRSNNDLVARLHAERTERLDKLEVAIKECETDRRELWEKLLEHTSPQ